MGETFRHLYLWLVLVIMLHTIRRIRPFHVVKPASSIHSSFRYTSLLQRTFTTLPDSNIIYSSATDEIIEKYKDELVSLRGDPELIDRLESLTVKHPGIEVNPKLYQLFFPFKLDDFQLRGLSSLIAGNNVLVMTPTGSGKTIVGELAIYFALMMGLRVVYTTPLKALSNQKFQDFRKRFGGDRVGLLTGEISINKFAPVVIMTTEVLRNMIYDTEASNRDSLNNIFMVCFDEFHYMNDPDRGTVWEECLISCPPEIRILALSATVGNIHEIKDWISNIHGPTEIIQSDYRPVPLRYLYALRPGLFPYFRDPNAGPGSLNGITKKNGDLDGGSKINPSILRIEQDAVKEFARYSSGKDRKGGGGRRRESDDNEKNGKTLTKNDQMAISRNLIPSYNKIIEELRKLNKLPAIFFIFSRDGCEEAARNAGNTLRKVKLLNREEKLYIENAVDNFLKLNPLIPVNQESINLLKNGISVHHAGLITVWKGLIEELFIANKIKVLFATETLAAGVNMPARTTVITSVSKKIGKSTTTLRTSQLLQMAGRAGRRGKDTEGTVVLMRNRFDSATEPHRILVAPIDGIKSQFKASYAFVIKLLSTKTIEDCRVLIERGFGTFLAQKYARKRKNKTKAVTMTSEDGGNMKLFPILLKYSLPELKSYVKLMNRIKKEKNSLDYLISKNIDTDEEIIDIFTEYMSIGSILQLKSGDIGYFLGDMMIEENSIYFYSDDARMLSLQKEREPSNRMDSKEGEDEPKKNFLQNLFSPALSSTIPPPTYSNRILQTTEPFDVSDEAVDKSFGKKKKKGVNQSSNRIPAYGMITQSGDFLCFTKNDIQHLVSLETPLQSSLPQIEDSSVFDKLVGLIMHIQGWEKTPYKHPLQENRVHSPRPSQYFYKARYQLQDLQATNSDVYNAIQYVLSLPSHESPDDLVAQQQRQNHEIIKQEKILVQLQQEFQTHPMTVSNDTTVIQEFFDHAATIKDNKDFKIFIDTQMRVLNATRTNADNLKTVGNEEALNRAGGALEVSDAWLMFLEVIKVLEAFKAIELLPPLPEQPSSFELPPTNSTEAVSPDSPIPKVSKRLTYRSTEFGEMVGSFTTDNDLWVSLVISHPAIERLTVHEFAGLMAAIMCDSSKVITAFYQYETSKNVQEVIEQLLPAYQSLYDLQQKYELDFPILLASEIAGIVEQWSKGMTWLELCSATSLEQGDLYRILKRTVEILRSIPQAYQVSIDVVEKAKEALVSVNRFPLIETIEDELEASNVKLPPEVQRGNNTSLSEFETPINESPEELSHLELEEEELEEIDKDFVDRDEEVESDSNDDDESLLSKIGREDEITVDDFLPFKKSSSPLSKVANGGKERKGVRTSVKEVVVEESLFDFTEDDFLDEDLNEENHDVEKIIVDLNDEEGDDVKALLAGIERDMTGQQKENMEEAVKKIKKPLKMIKRRSKGKKE